VRPTETVARAFVAGLNAHDADAVADLVTPDFLNEHTSALGQTSRGREVYRARLSEFFRQLPGLRYETEEIVADADHAMVAYALSARPEGHCVNVRGVFRLEIEDGLIAHRIDYWDSLGYLRQVQAADPGVRAVDHVQLAMPAGGEETARGFYHDLLGLTEVPKPEVLKGRGGCWFERAEAKVHLGVEAEFRPARKAHPALVVGDLTALTARLEGAGLGVVPAEEEQARARCFVDDPFGNRLELIEGPTS
jgi:ketosteroid isomerase-like protein/catechol 2,3-dioxygenase-like lactoylglutathione lyase family enzyme